MEREKIESYLNAAFEEASTRVSPKKYMGIPIPFKGAEKIPGKIGAKTASTKEAYREAEPKTKDSYQTAYQNAKDALTACGKVLEEDDVTGVITGMVCAGIQDMNPAVLVIDVEQENLKISAYAKEGVINQHTAEKAIEKFVDSL